MNSSIYNFSPADAAGKPHPLAQYEGQVLLIVNTASKCGFTPQYEALEALYQKYKAQGLTILAFPSDQFGGQEPGTDAEIQSFCQVNYGVTFPVLAKTEVNGEGASELYQYLKDEQGGLLGSRIKWNFTKFLVNRRGEVVERFAPQTTPDKLTEKIEKLLNE